MKTLIFNFAKIATITLVFSVLFSACNKDFDPNLPPLGDPAVALNGTWKLQTITQTDQVIKAKEKPSLDITEFVLNGGAVTASFNNTTKAYTLTSTARVNYLGTSGTFAFDDPNYPTKIVLTDAAGKKSNLTLGAALRPERASNLLLRYDRMKNGKPSVSYNYTFVKQ